MKPNDGQNAFCLFDIDIVQVSVRIQIYLQGEELQNLRNQDYEYIHKFWCFGFYSVTIRYNLIPHAVPWFTEEALADEDDYDDDNE